jgi:hypothetical protein
VPAFSNWNDLVSAAQAACADILKTEVAKTAKAIVDKHIQSDIYDAYSPAGYESGGYSRRGALGSPGNTIDKMIDEETLLITNIAPPSPPVFGGGSSGAFPDELLYWINEGLVPNYFNDKDYPWMHPRPAIDEAQEEINTSQEINAAINSGVKRVFG